MEAGCCVVCASPLEPKAQVVPEHGLADRRVEEATARLQRADIELAAAREALGVADDNYKVRIEEIHRLTADLAERSAEIDELIRTLPGSEVEIHRQRSEIAGLRAKLAAQREDLERKRYNFRSYVQDKSKAVTDLAEEIKAAFAGYASQFLYERSMLAWSPRRASVGQGGAQMEFPAFELDLSGADFQEPNRRAGPEQVSESQREFIDLAFRMALMRVVGSDSRGSLVIDAPESSLDAVFSPRAAEVLSRFATAEIGNRLVVASNIIDGGLIPTLLEKAAPVSERDRRVVDLLSIATPTAAVRQNRDEYEKARDRILSAGQGGL
jgi:hypothetical protein